MCSIIATNHMPFVATVCYVAPITSDEVCSMLSQLLPPQYGTHSLLAFTLVLYHILSVVFLKPTVSIRPLVPPSGSRKCLRFSLWSTLCTIKYFVYLFTYLLTLMACPLIACIHWMLLPRLWCSSIFVLFMWHVSSLNSSTYLSRIKKTRVFLVNVGQF